MPPPTPRLTPPTSKNGTDAASTAISDTSSAPTPSPEVSAAVAQLQRLSAQFLGIVSFIPPAGVTYTMKARAKAAQDKVRECGGLELLLSMCQIDERNPSESAVSPVACLKLKLTFSCARSYARTCALCDPQPPAE